MVEFSLVSNCDFVLSIQFSVISAKISKHFPFSVLHYSLMKVIKALMILPEQLLSMEEENMCIDYYHLCLSSLVFLANELTIEKTLHMESNTDLVDDIMYADNDRYVIWIMKKNEDDEPLLRNNQVYIRIDGFVMYQKLQNLW